MSRLCCILSGLFMLGLVCLLPGRAAAQSEDPRAEMRAAAEAQAEIYPARAELSRLEAAFTGKRQVRAASLEALRTAVRDAVHAEVTREVMPGDRGNGHGNASGNSGSGNSGNGNNGNAYGADNGNGGDGGDRGNSAAAQARGAAAQAQQARRNSDAIQQMGHGKSGKP